MKSKFLALLLCLIMILSLAFIGCEEEEAPPAPPPPPPPVENVLDNLVFSDSKVGATTIKAFEFGEDVDFFTDENFIGTTKNIYDTEDETKLISTENKLYCVHNDTVIAITVDKSTETTDPNYANVVTNVSVTPCHTASNFYRITISYGDGSKGDIRLYNKYGVMLQEIKGISSTEATSKIQKDQSFNSVAPGSYGVRYFSFLNKIYSIKADDLTLTEVIDFNKMSFNLSSVIYSKELDKYLSYSQPSSSSYTTKVAIFDKSFVLQSAHEFIKTTNSSTMFVNFLSPTVAIYTEAIPLPWDASEYDIVVDGGKSDIKITRFDFVTGEGTELALGDIILSGRDSNYAGLSYDTYEDRYNYSLKEKYVAHSFYTVSGKSLLSNTERVVVDNDLKVVKYIESPLPSDPSSEVEKLPNGEMVMETTYGVYHLNADGTLGALLNIDADIEYNNIWRIQDEKEVYDNTNTLIYTIPETRELVSVLNNSLLLKEDVKDEEGTKTGEKYILWKGVGVEAQIGDIIPEISDPSKIPTEGTITTFDGDSFSDGYYITITFNWADMAIGSNIGTVTIFDDLGTQIAKYENMIDFDIDYGDTTDFLEIETKTVDAEENEIYKTIVVVLKKG